MRRKAESSSVLANGDQPIPQRVANIITCDDDEQAIDRARKLKKHFAVEVWQVDRLIAKID